MCDHGKVKRFCRECEGNGIHKHRPACTKLDSHDAPEAAEISDADTEVNLESNASEDLDAFSSIQDDPEELHTMIERYKSTDLTIFRPLLIMQNTPSLPISCTQRKITPDQLDVIVRKLPILRP